MFLKYLAPHLASFNLDFRRNDELCKGHFNASEPTCILFLSRTDDHCGLTKPQELHHLGLITCVEIVPFSTSKARNFENECQAKEGGMYKDGF